MSPALRERFELRSRILTDALGEVWHALAHDPPGPVRVRLLNGSGLTTPEVRGALLECARRAARVRSPGLPEPIAADLDPESGAVYLATTWPDGETLGARLRREGRLSFAEGIRVAREVASALETTWRAERLPHAHLTADRIHLWPEGRAGVLELGATAVEELARAGLTGTMLRLLRAAPHFVAPELVRGGANLDARTDIYSLGAVLYYTWTGRLPFGDSPAPEALDKHLMGFLDDPCELNPDLPLAAGWMLERWMSRSPDRRPPEWSAALADLEAVAQQRPPGGERLPAGASVIRRGARRDPELAQRLNRPAARLPRRPLRTTSGSNGTAKVTLPAPPPSGPVPVARSGGGDFARIMTIALLLVAAAAWFARDHLRALFQGPPTVARPVAPPVVRPAAPSAEPAPAQTPSVTLEEILGLRPVALPPPVPPSPRNHTNAIATEPPPAPAEENPAAPDPLMAHPAFHRAAQMFNESLQLFGQYRQTARPEILDRVEQLAEEAARMFEEVQRTFPADRRLRRYVEQCYGMVRYARQTRLSDGHLNGGDRRPRRGHPTPPRAPLPAPPSSVAPTPPRLSPAQPPSDAPPSRPREPALAPDWNAPLRIGAGLARELSDILRVAGPPPAAAIPSLLPGGVPYLEPFDRAAARLGIPPPSGSGTDITFPGFPARSLRYFEFSAPPNSGPFTTGRLIVDGLGQTVGIQWMDERPAAPMLPEEHFSPKWSIADPVAGRIREKSSHRVGHRGRCTDGVVSIETEIVDPTAPPETRSIARYRLDLAEPLARLILERPAAAP
ncbi:MAG: hypothetical protein N2652_02265 [Kiritimatiellae bacterium]|nr:hypothetical protein [Kiritimatiellia bacterium]